MLDKETYKKELIRMWDSVRVTNKGSKFCHGVPCGECPLRLVCNNNECNAFEIIKEVEKWSNEHPPKHKISQLEYDILCVALDHECVEFGDFYMLSDILDPEAEYFEGAIYETNIIDYLKNCEVEDNKK